MKHQVLQIDKIVTKRLILIPFTIKICKNILHGNFNDLKELGLKKGKNWPDPDVLETLPKIVSNLSQVESPTGFESWMIIKKDTLEIIGDAGFKGYNNELQNSDIGYGVIAEERQKGYAQEAAEALIKWAFSNEMVKEITASCLVSNSSSIKLLEKLNFTPIKAAKEMLYWSLKNKE